MTVQDINTRKIEVGKLTIDVFNASENSFGVTSVIVSGKEEAVLIDAQFTLSDAELVAHIIQKSGKRLTTIYVSHGDPDFYFGLQVFKKYFPEVTVYAAPATIAHIKDTAQKKLEVWGDKLSKAITSNVVLPQLLKENAIALEGERLEIIGLDQFPKRTFVWISSMKAVLGGINIFGNTFNVWMADAQTSEARSEWISVLDEISKLNPEIVIPAHSSKNALLDITSVKHTREYIQFYEEALKLNTTSEALIKAIKAKYPDLSFEIALQLGAKVNTKEIPW